MPPVKTSTKIVLILLILSSARFCSYQNSGTQLSNEVQNLIAFARLYGHVKYFHPSDEAVAVDWDTFAIYGAGKVREAKNREELKAALDSLFLPIAPTIRISTEETAATPFISTYLKGLNADTTGLLPVAWQHLGVSLKAPGIVYNSLRVNKLPVDEYSLHHNVDIQRVAGRHIRLRVALKTALTHENSEARVSIRVEKGQSELSRSISSTYEESIFGLPEDTAKPDSALDKWKIIEVKRDIDEHPKAVTIGIRLSGPGTLWIDDVDLSARTTNGSWEPIPVTNAGFEAQYLHSNDQKVWLDPLEGWRVTTGRSYIRKHRNQTHINTHTWLASANNYGAVTDSISSSGNQSYRIRIPTQIFDEYPNVGETSRREIAPGLYSEVPLALYADEEHTLPQGDKEAIEQLKKQISAVRHDSTTANDVNVQLADVIIAWNVFQHFYPYFDVTDTDWEQQLIGALQGALTDQTADDFYVTLSRMLASLHDGHIWLHHPSQNKSAGLPFLVDWVDDKVVVTHSRHKHISPGDIIRTLDGVPAEEIVRSQMELISGSPQHARFLSLRLFGAGKPDTQATVEVLGEDGDSTYTVPRTSRPTVAEKEWSHLPVLGEIEEDVYYVNLSKAPMSRIHKELEKIAAAKGVIFDLRGYPNSNHQVISHLLTEPDTSDQWYQVPKYVYPDRQQFLGYQKSGWNLRPAEPHIPGKAVFLTDARAVSYAESFLSFIEYYKLGEIVGQPTGGVNGVVNSVSLPGGFAFLWTGAKVVKHDGSQHHLVGIQPTVLVEKSIRGIRNGRDEILERALELVRP